MDRQYYKNMLTSLEALYTVDLSREERRWVEADEFEQSEFLSVSLVDADRWLGKLKEAERNGSLPEDLITKLRYVEQLIEMAKPRIEKLKSTMKLRPQ